jgi:steroid delta-isomerase-like uncharacterized protein
MTASNLAVVRRLYEEVWNHRMIEVVDELISPSHALYGPRVSGSAMGPEAYKRQVRLWLAGFPDLQFTVEDTIGELEKLVVAWIITGTHQGEFMGVPATSKKISVDGVTIHHIANGKIMDSHGSWDALGILQQMGVVPTFGQPRGATAT